MKTIYLRNENYQWKDYIYEDLSELKSDFNRLGISVGYRASIGNGASIGGLASIGCRASIGYRASIGDGARIGDGVKINKCFYIAGSKHSITYAGNGKLSIGCHTKDITEWFNVYESIGQKEGYSPEEIEEYLGYIKLADQFHKNLKNETN